MALIQQQQIQVPNYLGAIQAGQEQQLNRARLEAYNNERIKAERENQRLAAIDQLSQASLTNPEAMNKLAQIDPDRAKKNFDYLFERSAIGASYATAINLANRDKKPAVYKEVLKMARSDPRVDQQELSQFPDDYSPDLDAKLYAISQGHRKLEDALKVQQESANLSQTKAQTASTYADIDYKKAQTANVRKEGALKDKELKGQKPMSGEAAKISTIAQGGISAVKDLGDILDKNDINDLAALNQLPNALQGTKTQKFGVLRTDLSDLIGRLRSGGQISLNEEATYKNLIPKFGDSKSTQAYKLKRLGEIFGGLDEKLGRAPSAAENISGGDPLGLFK